MTITNESNTIKLYEAYGLQFIGKIADYTSCITNETETVITDIAIIETETNNVIYKEKLYNRFIFFLTFEKYCDDILYFFSENKQLDEIGVETIMNRLITNSLIGFSVNITRQKKAEKEIEKQVFELVEKNNLIQYEFNGNFYIMKMTPEDAEKWNMLADSAKNNVLKMASKNNFPEIEIMYIGSCSFVYVKMQNGEYLKSYTGLKPVLKFLEELEKREV